jgi:nucleotide-binding universal stress UspA family protein
MASVLKVLVASDGSRSSKAAIETVLRFPWPEKSTGQGIVALRGHYVGLGSNKLVEAAERGLRDAATEARNLLASRWAEARIAVVDRAPVQAILQEARRSDCAVIALGWRGHGAARRLVAGSVSRAIAMRAPCSVLIARTAPADVSRFVIAYDDGLNARRAVKLLTRLEPRRGMRAVLVNVIARISVPPRTSRLPARLRAGIRSDIAAMNTRRRKQAKAATSAAASRLKEAGWTTEIDIRTGSALEAVLKAVRQYGADVLVIGARETGGLEHVLVGSVAQGAMNHSPVPVLIVR